MASIACKTKDCFELAFLYSWSEGETIKTVDYNTKEIHCTKRYRCKDNHRTIVDTTETMPIIKEKHKPRTVDDSIKRFHRKGFSNHVVKKPGESKHRNPITRGGQYDFPPEMTNREKNEWRRDRRQNIKEATNAKAK